MIAIAGGAPPHREWGTFIRPDPSLSDVENLHEKLDITIYSGYRAALAQFAGMSPIFDEIAAIIAREDLRCEDQCTGQHYFDVFRRVDLFCRTGPATEVRRVVDVGVYMGGSASIFAGCVESMGVELDLVDTNSAFLRFTYERLRRAFPQAASNVRMFYGDLPTYVQRVILSERGVSTLVHHDAAHDFPQVVKDLAALYYVRRRVHGVAIQDTHLRCTDIDLLNFVDAAVYAVFGADLVYEPLGMRYGAASPLMEPNHYHGNYFLAARPEGMYIPLAQNRFLYPHPTMSLDSLVPPQAASSPEQRAMHTMP